MNFSTKISEIEQRIFEIDPIEYGNNRNYINGSVTYLSPYISRGVISTKQVFQSLIERGIPFQKCEKLIQELAWREYWQHCWDKLGANINEDIKRSQENCSHSNIPSNIIDANTSIKAIDIGLVKFYETGYLHNHFRMYIASLCCNVGRSHWKTPAQWMYYHLLDGDWGSNALSWQWVVGTNSSKKYFANQENINRFCLTNQQKTFLDVTYSDFPLSTIPEELKQTVQPQFLTILPQSKKEVILDKELPSCIYNYYNLDPKWKKEIKANRVLLLEPSIFKKYPVSQKCIEFILKLSSNIDEIQVFVGEFAQLEELLGNSEVYYKQHPLNSNYIGLEEDRDYIFKEKEHLNSFFSFWKRCKRELKFD